MKIATPIIILVVVTASIWAQTRKETFVLEPGKSAEREIAAGESHSYEIKIEKDQFLRAVIDQKSADISITLISPDNAKALEVDDPDIKRGPENVLFIAISSGPHRVVVSSKETGRYTAKIELLRAAVPHDRDRIAAEQLFIDGERLSARSAYAEAIVKYEEALRLLASADDSYASATILYKLGRAHYALGDKEKSSDHFRRSMALYQTAGSWDEIFKDLRPLYALMGGPQKTSDYLSGALPLVRALKNQRLEAILLTSLAKVSEDLGQPGQALDHTQQALELFRITGKRGAEIFTLTEISDADLTLEEKRKAVDYLNQALLLANGASDRALEASLLTGIGYIYASIDEHQKSLQYFQRSLPVWRAIKDKSGEAYTLEFIGSIYFMLGENQLARDYFEQAITVFRQTSDLRAEAYAVSSLGIVASRSGDINKAEECFEKALKVFRDAGERNGESIVLSYLAEISWNRGDRLRAQQNYEASLSISRSIGSREGEAIALNNLAYVYDSTGNVDQALIQYERALPIFRLLGNRTGEALSLYGVARVMYARGNLDEALQKIETTINIVESLRANIVSTDLRASYLASYQNLYRFYVDVLMRLNQNRPGKGFDELALKASERARARSLLDTLAEARADLRAGADKALLDRESSLQKKLNAKDNERRRSPNDLQSAALDREIQALTEAYRDLQAEIKLKSPQYAALMKPHPLGAKDIRALLDPDTLLLEYTFGGDNTYLWVVSPTSLKSYTLPKRAVIERMARAFYEAVSRPNAEVAAKKSSDEMSKILLGPAASELGNKRLVIVADGVLQYLPFAALVSNGQSLIVYHEIDYLPSASIIGVLRDGTGNRISATKTIAVVADPVFDASDTRITRTDRSEPPGALNSTLANATRDTGFAGTLPRLPGTRREATSILSLVAESEGKRAVDFDASRAMVKSGELAHYRMIHFATHGLLNSVHPELSGIVLSLVDDKGKPQDGFLRLNEIFNLRLPADLVVLSACRTALGKEINGEGLIGLTRGFMYAGARRVVASQWAVDDQATSELMRLFYQSMLGEKKLQPAAALREAQIAMLKNKRFSSPYFWSAFTIQGDWK